MFARFFLCLVLAGLFSFAESVAGGERLDDCLPGDSVILVVPEDQYPFPHQLSYCLYICEGRTYTLQIPTCAPELMPVVWWVPGCSPDFTDCFDPECAPTQDVLFDPNFGFWDPSIPGWVFFLFSLPGGAEGCVCVTVGGPLGWWYWNGECWLSVELMSFSAVPQGEAIHIEFATASETDNDNFEIWRGQSPEGEFIKIAELPSQGNSPSGHHYSYVDADVTIGTTYWYYLADVDLQGIRTEHRDRMTSARVEASIPLDYALFQNYPNPFNAAAEIGYAIPVFGHVTLTVFDAMGRRVTTLADGVREAGVHHVTFEAGDLPSGIYFVTMQTSDFAATKKMLLLK